MFKNFVGQHHSCAIPHQDLQAIPAFRPEDHCHPGMRIKLQLGLHQQSPRLMPAAEVHRPRRDQDRQSLARDDHAISRIARTRATTRSTGTSAGTCITTSWPICSVKTVEAASGSSGSPKTFTASLGSAVIAKGTNAGPVSPPTGKLEPSDPAIGRAAIAEPASETGRFYQPPPNRFDFDSMPAVTAGDRGDAWPAGIFRHR